MKKTLQIGLGCAAVAAFVCVAPLTASAHHEHLAAAAGAAAPRTYVLTVEGMSCPISCAPKVKEALEKIEGVESVEVDFDKKRAVVHVSQGHSLSSEQCDKAFGNSGYFVDTIEEMGAEEPAA